MAREVPYRSKAPPAVLQLMEEALAATFFLVQETGPLSFVLKDEAGKVLKVKLGSTHSCTCGGGRAEHCVHTLYTLLRVFKVLPNNPVTWQLSFNEGEINWLIRNRLNPVSAKPQPRAAAKSQHFERINLSDEFGCSICQDDMKPGQSLVYCKVSCGHNFHARCMKVWADHKLASNEPITCPLCRTDWGRASILEIQRMAKKAGRAAVTHKAAACVICGVSPIRGEWFHCLSCEAVDLCKRCRPTHSHFLIVKTKPNQPWVGDSTGDHLQALQHRELQDEDYQALLELDRRTPLPEFALHALPPAVAGSCCICGIPQPCKLRQLACNHVAHEPCLLTRLREAKYICPVDERCVLPGLSLFVPEKVQPRPAEQLFVGGHGLVGARGGQNMRRRPEVRVRRVVSRPMAAPQLMITGFQSMPGRR